MTQDEWLILVLKIVLISGAVSIALFIAEYSWRTGGAAWRNDIGRTLLWAEVLLVACLTPSILSLFFSFSRFTSHIATWVDVVLFGLLTPATLWRVAVFEAIHRDKPKAGGRHATEDGEAGT